MSKLWLKDILCRMSKVAALRSMGIHVLLARAGIAIAEAAKGMPAGVDG